jgi:nickel-dependent lactate racemase
MSPRTLSLRYGCGRLPWTVNDSAEVLEIREPKTAVSRDSFREGLKRILASPLTQGPVTIVVADKTRLCGYPVVLPWLTEFLRERGVERSQITFAIAYGNHCRQSETESLAAYGPIYKEYRFIHHQSTAPTIFADLGRTSRGTPIRVRADLLQAGLILTVGAISHHYFAGFGGGRKLLFPGLGEQEAIYANHRLFLDPERRALASGCRPGRMNGNPLAEDLAEIEEILPRYYSIHGQPNSRGEIAAYRFGRSSAEFLAACREHDAVYRAPSCKQYDIVLASAGGYPKDINLIQAHKAIDNATAFVQDGGTLLLLAECPDGIGSTTFLPYFDLGGPGAAFAHLTGCYSGNGGTALALMAKTARIRIVLVTALDDALCNRIGLTRINGEEAMRWIETVENLAVIPNASMLIQGAKPS